MAYLTYAYVGYLCKCHCGLCCSLENESFNINVSTIEYLIIITMFIMLFKQFWMYVAHWDPTIDPLSS